MNVEDLPALADSLTQCGLTRSPPMVLITRWQALLAGEAPLLLDANCAAADGVPGSRNTLRGCYPNSAICYLHAEHDDHWGRPTVAGLPSGAVPAGRWIPGRWIRARQGTRRGGTGSADRRACAGWRLARPAAAPATARLRADPPPQQRSGPDAVEAARTPATPRPASRRTGAAPRSPVCSMVGAPPVGRAMGSGQP